VTDTDTPTPFADDDDDDIIYSTGADNSDFDFDKMFGEEADLSLVYPPNGMYNAIIKGVLHQEKVNTDGPNTGKTSRGWNISVQLDVPSGDLASYNGTFYGKYIWLGFKPNFTPNGLRELCSFLSAATGDDWEGRTVDFREFRPEVREIRGRRNVAMSYFDELPICVTLNTADELDKRTGLTTKRTKIVGWHSQSDYVSQEDPY
jgi:hypothetical protein